MLPEEKPDIENNAITSESTSQEQVSQSKYGYGILEGSDRINVDYPWGGSGVGDGRGEGQSEGQGEGQSEGMNSAGLGFADEELPTTPTTISRGTGPFIPGNDRDEHGEFPPGGAPDTPIRRRDRVSEYEEYCRRNPLIGGKGKKKGQGGGAELGLGRDTEVVEFRVKKKVWSEGVGSPIARFPNGEDFQIPILWWC